MRSETSIPSFRSSPWMRGAPHNGLAVAISTINLRSSGSSGGRPARLRPEHRAQRRRSTRDASGGRSQVGRGQGPSASAATRQTARPRTFDPGCAAEGASRAVGFGAAAAGPCSRARDRGVRGRPQRSRVRPTRLVRSPRNCGVSGSDESTPDGILANDRHEQQPTGQVRRLPLYR